MLQEDATPKDDSPTRLFPNEKYVTLHPEDSVSSVGHQSYVANEGQVMHTDFVTPQFNSTSNPNFEYKKLDNRQQHDSRLSYRSPSQDQSGYNDSYTSAEPHEMESTAFTPESSNYRGSSSRSRRESDIFQQDSTKRYFPWFSYSVSILHAILLIVALLMNKSLTGSLIEPITSNYMIGPSPVVLIREGARFVPCMKKQDFQEFTFANCPIEEGVVGNCTLEEICGFDDGNQWYRVILPIFLHAGIIHLLSNLFFQITLLKDLEKIWAWFRIIPIFLISGTFSFLFGATYSKISGASYSKTSGTQPAVGSSGALFGIIAALLINLLIHWNSLHKPAWQLFNLLVIIVISILFGVYVPFIDNYAHIGGLLMGIGNSLVFAPYETVRKTLRRISVKKSLIYSSWFPWTCRFFGLAWTVILYSVVANDFYSNKSSCSFCGTLGN
eukprot:NODE_204_length_14945_cov_0.251313.p2 type:complete len:441 gc:universal NODE_204_length_14945_cov_0.251313:4681-3359(-)